MLVILKDIYHGTGARSSIIYAHLYSADTGDLVISATLDYILNAIEERGYILVKEKK